MFRVASNRSALSAGPVIAVDTRAIFPAASKAWRQLHKALFDTYRPELHYMRGPGPKWRERQGALQRLDLRGANLLPPTAPVKHHIPPPTEVGSRSIAELESQRDEVLLGLLELRTKAEKTPAAPRAAARIG